MRSVQNVAECLVCRLTPLVSPQRKPIDLIYAFTRGYNRGLVHDNSCFCCFFENEFEISQAAPTVTSFLPSLPPTHILEQAWHDLGIKCRRDENPCFPSVNNYVAVSESVISGISERTRASALCQLRVQDVDLEAQM